MLLVQVGGSIKQDCEHFSLPQPNFPGFDELEQDMAATVTLETLAHCSSHDSALPPPPPSPSVHPR